MALYIIRYPGAKKDDLSRTKEARVEIRQRRKLSRFFGPREGSVLVKQTSPCLRLQAVPPVWRQGESNEWETMSRCYSRCLQLAWEENCETIQMPLLASEEPAFPAYIDYKIAVETIREFLKTHTMDVYLEAFHRTAFQMAEFRADVERLLSTHTSWEQPWQISSFADRKSFLDAFSLPPAEASRKKQAEKAYDQRKIFPGDAPVPPSPHSTPMPPSAYGAPMPPIPSAAKESVSFNTGALPSISELEELLKTTDAGFSETLMKLIDQSGKKDSVIYNKANVSRQHFSKIRNNPDYKPTKPTAIAFAIALELDMEQTQNLIGRAGYTLTDSSKFDVIIKYFIQRRIYDMFDINDMLYAFDQSLLGV